MEHELTGSYHLALVFLAFGIAVLASYTALDLANRARSSKGYAHWLWQIGGALGMGTGIWAMHFIAMLAFRLPLTVHYDLLTTLLSLVYAVVASGIALALLSRPSTGEGLWIVGGVCMGLAITWMHYTGMSAMQMQAHMSYQWPLVVLSCAMAVGASWAALWLAFRLQTLPKARQAWQKAGSALIMGTAISGMHYTGMAATHFRLTTDLPLDTAPRVSQSGLAVAVAIATLLLLALALISSRFDRRLAQQRLRQQALQDSEQRFRTLIRDMQVGVVVFNDQAEILLSNPTACELLGLDSQEQLAWLFTRDRRFFRESGSPIPLEALPVQQAISQREPVRSVVLGLEVPPQSDPVWLLVNADPEINEAGEVERVVCTLSDISVRKRAEAAVRELAEREKAISQIVLRMRQSLKLDTIFDATTAELRQALSCDRVLIYQFKPDWSGSLASESVAEGWSALMPARQQDANITQVAIDYPGCATVQMEADGLIQDTHLQETEGGIYRQRNSYCCVPDVEQAGFADCYLALLDQLQAKAYIIAPIFCGHQLWGLLAAYQNSGPRHWQIAEVRIVTQVGNQLGVAVQQAELFAKTQQQAEELLLAKETAVAASRSKTEFLANMSHELRTPLNAILGFSQLIQRQGPLSSEHQHYIEIINQSGEHLLTLINDVLELSKIEAGQVSLNPADFSLHRLLQGLEAMLQMRAQAKRLTLTLDVGPDVPEQIHADENKLRQILINLMGNALKFTQQGRVTLRVRTLPPSEPLTATSPLTLTFEVEDTGPGIEAAELAGLFTAFYQTQTGRAAQEGTGLGLRISQKFVHLMGGEITVTSEVGQGSCFRFSIPVKLAQAMPPLAPSSHAVAGIATDQPKYRILVAEDNLVNRLLLVKMLDGLGLEVQEAENGQSAIALWQQGQPDLIFMDMHMPILDGFTATRHIKEAAIAAADSTAVAPTRPVIIAITASAFAEQQQQCLAAGCDDCVSKPFRRDEILQVLAQHLGLRYRYEAISPLPPKATQAAHTPPLQPVDLSHLSTDWVSQLHRAAAQGNDTMSLKLIAQLPSEQAPLMEALTHLVENYQFDQIMLLTQK